MGRARHRARSDSRVSRQKRRRGSHTSSVSVPAGCYLQGQREHRRGGEFCLQDKIAGAHMNVRTSLFIGVILLTALLFSPRPRAAASCESLAALSLPHITVTLANLVDAGTFVQFPAGRGGPPAAPPPARGAGGGRGAGVGGGRG